MADPAIVPFDLQRMFLGDYAPLYYAEVAFRVAVIYGYTLLLIRWIGGRGMAQLSLVEFLLVIALGSAVGDAMFYDDVPLLIAMWVITLVVVINKLLDKLIIASRRAEDLIDGRPLALVHNGVLIHDGLSARDLGVNEVKAMLRKAGVANLGEVEHAYMEVNGGISVFRLRTPRAGLAIVPPPDAIPPETSDETDETSEGRCCTCCGMIVAADAARSGSRCPNCAGDRWTAAVTPDDDSQDDQGEGTAS